MQTQDKIKIIGIVEKRLYDGRIYNAALREQELGHLDLADKLFRLARKKIFQANLLWKVIKKITNLDIQIQFLTGSWEFQTIERNLITTRGKRIIAERLVGISTNAVTAMAIGIGTNTPNPANTTLQSEITSGGGERGAATTSNQTTSSTGDTGRLVKQFTFTLPFTVTEEGLFDNAVSGGNMLARQTFAGISVIATDIIEITHNVIFS